MPTVDPVLIYMIREPDQDTSRAPQPLPSLCNPPPAPAPMRWLAALTGAIFLLLMAGSSIRPVLAFDQSQVDHLIKTRDYTEARKMLERQATIDPGNVDLLLQLADVDHRLGDLDEAIKRAREATEADPKDPAPHFLLGRYFDENRDDLSAVTQYEVVLELKAPLKLRLASYGPYLRLLVKRGRLKEAQKLAKKWARENPDEPDCHFNYAWILTQPDKNEKQEKRDKEAAIEEYQACLKLDPKRASTRFNLALLLIQAGQGDEALKQLQLFVKQAPKDPDVETAQKLIKQLKSG